MSNLDYIKSYLIKVGVDVDGNTVNKYDQFIKKTDSKLGNLVKKISGYGVKVNAFWDAILVGSYKFGSSIAKADMDLQKLARRMYMSRDSAKALQTTLNAMGLDQGDLQDIALNPELTGQYRELLRLSRSLGTPEGVKETLKDIRSINFEFSKLNVIFSHFMERVVHFAFRTLGKPAKDFRKFLQDFNERFAKNIDAWAKRIGTALGIIVRLAVRFKQLLADAGGYISGLWSKLSKLQKGIVLAIGAIGIALKASPLWKLIALISGFLMLIDDYKVYKEGGVSAKVLKPVWRQVDNQLNNPDSMFNKLKDIISESISDPLGLLKEIKSKLEGWYEDFKTNHPIISNILTKVEGLAQSISESLSKLFDPEGRKQLISDIKEKFSKLSSWIDNFFLDLQAWYHKNLSDFQNWYDNLIENSPTLKAIRDGLIDIVNWIREKLGLPLIEKPDPNQPKILGSGKSKDSKLLSDVTSLELPKNPWSPEGYERLQRIAATQKMKGPKEDQSWKDFGYLPKDIWHSDRRTNLQQIFNFKIEGIQKPEELAKEFSTIVRNNKPNLVS
jgi:hypothetical protein